MAKLPKPQTFLDKCDKLTPSMVRVHPKKKIGKKKRILSHHELSKRCDLPARTVQRLASTKSWDGVKIGTASKFLDGCNVDLFHPEEVMAELLIEADNGFPSFDSKQRSYFFKIMQWVAP